MNAPNCTPQLVHFVKKSSQQIQPLPLPPQQSPSNPNPEQLIQFSGAGRDKHAKTNPESPLDYTVETFAIKGT